MRYIKLYENFDINESTDSDIYNHRIFLTLLKYDVGFDIIFIADFENNTRRSIFKIDIDSSLKLESIKSSCVSHRTREDEHKYYLLINNILVDTDLSKNIYDKLYKLYNQASKLSKVINDDLKIDMEQHHGIYIRRNKDFLDRLEEFEVIKNNKIDWISLNSLYDFYGKEFNEINFKQKLFTPSND